MDALKLTSLNNSLSSSCSRREMSPKPMVDKPDNSPLSGRIGDALVKTVESVTTNKMLNYGAGKDKETRPELESTLQLKAPADMEKCLADLSQDYNVNMTLTTDKDTGRYIVQVLSADGSRVLRQMPPESVLAFLKRHLSGESSLVTAVV